MGHPYELLVAKIGDEDITRAGGVFEQLVKQTGEANAEKIFEIASNNYKEKPEY